MNKQILLEKMIDEMPYKMPKNLLPYIYEAMDIYAKETAKEFADWARNNAYNCDEVRYILCGEINECNWMYPDEEVTTEQLYEQFLKQI